MFLVVFYESQIHPYLRFLFLNVNPSLNASGYHFHRRQN